LAQPKPCSPTCPAFKCVKNSLFFRREGAWCRLTEELCTVSKCTYAICAKRRLLPTGVCGETVKRKTVEKEPDDLIKEPVKLRGKALRKLGERDLF